MSARSLRDAGLVAHIVEVLEDHVGVYDIRKMRHTLCREEIDIGDEHTARLMDLEGVRDTKVWTLFSAGKPASAIATLRNSYMGLRVLVSLWV